MTTILFTMLMITSVLFPAEVFLHSILFSIGQDNGSVSAALCYYFREIGGMPVKRILLSNIRVNRFLILLGNVIVQSLKMWLDIGERTSFGWDTTWKWVKTKCHTQAYRQADAYWKYFNPVSLLYPTVVCVRFLIWISNSADRLSAQYNIHTIQMFLFRLPLEISIP